MMLCGHTTSPPPAGNASASNLDMGHDGATVVSWPTSNYAREPFVSERKWKCCAYSQVLAWGADAGTHNPSIPFPRHKVVLALSIQYFSHCGWRLGVRVTKLQIRHHDPYPGLWGWRRRRDYIGDGGSAGDGGREEALYPRNLWQKNPRILQIGVR